MKKKNSQLSHFIHAYFTEIKQAIDALNEAEIEHAIDIIFEAYQSDKTIYILGNGGSASTASHMACDLGKGTLRRVYDRKEKRLHVVSLTDNVAIITAFANDVSYDDIFLQQLRNLIHPDDVLIAISGSGNSKNVIRAVKYAKKNNTKTIGILGFANGGILGKLVDCPIRIKSNHYGPIEDMQQAIAHIIASWIAKVKHEEVVDTKSKRNAAVPFSADY